MIAIDSKDIVEEARKIHQSTPVATAALAGSLIAGAMMGVMMKEEHAKMTLQFKGNGPLECWLVYPIPKGDVKGYFTSGGGFANSNEGQKDVSKGVGTEGNSICYS